MLHQNQLFGKQWNNKNKWKLVVFFCVPSKTTRCTQELFSCRIVKVADLLSHWTVSFCPSWWTDWSDGGERSSPSLQFGITVTGCFSCRGRQPQTSLWAESIATKCKYGNFLYIYIHIPFSPKLSKYNSVSSWSWGSPPWINPHTLTLSCSFDMSATCTPVYL